MIFKIMKPFHFYACIIFLFILFFMRNDANAQNYTVGVPVCDTVASNAKLKYNDKISASLDSARADSFFTTDSCLQIEKSTNQKNSKIPIIAFGVAGMVIGASIGGHTETQWEWGSSEVEINIEGILIGAGVGAIIGGTFGYLISKINKNEDRR